jgi:hypothetical protein
MDAAGLQMDQVIDRVSSGLAVDFSPRSWPRMAAVLRTTPAQPRDAPAAADRKPDALELGIDPSSWPRLSAALEAASDFLNLREEQPGVSAVSVALDGGQQQVVGAAEGAPEERLHDSDFVSVLQQSEEVDRLSSELLLQRIAAGADGMDISKTSRELEDAEKQLQQALHRLGASSAPMEAAEGGHVRGAADTAVPPASTPERAAPAPKPRRRSGCCGSASERQGAHAADQRQRRIGTRASVASSAARGPPPGHHTAPLVETPSAKEPQVRKLELELGQTSEPAPVPAARREPAAAEVLQDHQDADPDAGHVARPRSETPTEFDLDSELDEFEGVDMMQVHKDAGVSAVAKAITEAEVLSTGRQIMRMTPASCAEMGMTNLFHWQDAKMGDSAHALRRPTDGGLYQFYFEAHMSIPAEVLMGIQTDAGFRKSWDSYCKFVNVVSGPPVTEGSQVVHWEVKYPGPMTNRDYCYHRRQVDLPGGRVFMYVSRAAPIAQHAALGVPVQKRTIRTERFVACMVIQEEPSRNGKPCCKFQFQYEDDPKGNIPRWLIAYGATKGMQNVISDMYRGAKLFEAWSPNV